jgi:hypothetical protein
VRNNNNNNNNKSDPPVGHNAQDLVKRRIRPGESFESVFARGDIEGNGRDGTRRRCAGVLGATTDRHWCWLLSLAIQNSPWQTPPLVCGVFVMSSILEHPGTCLFLSGATAGAHHVQDPIVHCHAPFQQDWRDPSSRRFKK